jgi:hypothetical protein
MLLEVIPTLSNLMSTFTTEEVIFISTFSVTSTTTANIGKTGPKNWIHEHPDEEDAAVPKEEVELTELFVANDEACNDLEYLYLRIIEASKPEAGSGADTHDLQSTGRSTPRPNTTGQGRKSDIFTPEILFHKFDGLIKLEDYRWNKIAPDTTVPPPSGVTD